MKERVVKAGLSIPPSLAPSLGGTDAIPREARAFLYWRNQPGTLKGGTHGQGRFQPSPILFTRTPVQVLEDHPENGTIKRCLKDTRDVKEKKSLGVAGEMVQQL